MTGRPPVLLDWSGETVGAIGFEPVFGCTDGYITIQPHHWPGDVMSAHVLEVSQCRRCSKTLVRPRRAPVGMEYRWGSWVQNYVIEEEPGP